MEREMWQNTIVIGGKRVRLGEGASVARRS
jgi:hypothetical protein